MIVFKLFQNHYIDKNSTTFILKTPKITDFPQKPIFYSKFLAPLLNSKAVIFVHLLHDFLHKSLEPVFDYDISASVLLKLFDLKAFVIVCSLR